MSVLVDYQIAALCEQGMIDPYDPALINPASIDVRVGDTAVIEAEEGWFDYDMSKHTAEDPFWVMPKEFLLVATIETFNLPDCICGEFRMTSSRAREGHDNALAVWLDPGWTGSRLTMELLNNCRFHRLPLWKGRVIGQIILFSCDDSPQHSYAETGRYNNHDTVRRSLGDK